MSKTYKIMGTQGELDMVELIPCPNCGKKLMPLPDSYPLYDLQCTACTFRVQVKTSSSNPDKATKIRGSGYRILENARRVGMVNPPLIVNFHWKDKIGKEHREVRFYPFVWDKNIIKRIANIKSQNRKHAMYDYDLTGLLYYVLYSSS